MNAEHKRFPAYGNEKLISLAAIAIYTDNDEVPLPEVLEAIKEKENNGLIAINPKKAKTAELFDFLGGVLPEFDRERVYSNDIKKLISWYNILIENGITDFKVEEVEEGEQSEESAEAAE